MLLRGSVTRRALVKILEAHDTKFCECIEKQLNQVSTAGESIQRLKNRYTGFSVETSNDQVIDDESEFDVDEGYSEEGFKMVSRDVIDSDAGNKIMASTKVINKNVSREVKIINNIINGISTNMKINI